MAGYNRFPEIVARFEPAVSQIVRKSAFDVQALYASTCPRDTGFMASSAYVVTSKESTYGQGASTPPKGAYLLPEHPKPDDSYTAHVAVGANYAIFPELGTRHQPPQPAFYPAVDAVEPQFMAAMGKLEDAL